MVGKDVAGVPGVTKEHRRNRHAVSSNMKKWSWDPKEVVDSCSARYRGEIGRAPPHNSTM